MPTWLTYILIALAVHRITRIVTRDKFPLVALPRYYVTNWLDPSTDYRTHYRAKHPDRGEPRAHWGIFGSSLAYLWECDWCVSVWVSAAVVYCTSTWTSVPLPVLAWLAASTVTGLIASSESE